MSLEEGFNKAAGDVKNLNATPKDEELLEIYALYKQSILGDNETAKPGMFNFKDKAKWEAWNGKKGLEKEKAKENYIAKVKELINAYGLRD